MSSRATFYVDFVNGSDDTGDGSNGNPFKTVTYALVRMRADVPTTYEHYIYLKPGIHFISKGSPGGSGDPTRFETLTWWCYGHLHIEGIPDSNGVFPRVIIDYELYSSQYNMFLGIYSVQGSGTLVSSMTLKRIIFEGRGTKYSDFWPKFIVTISGGFLHDPSWPFGPYDDLLVDQCAFIGQDLPTDTYSNKTYGLYVGSLHPHIHNCSFLDVTNGLYSGCWGIIRYVKGCIFQNIAGTAIYAHAYMPNYFTDSLLCYNNNFHNVGTQIGTNFVGDNLETRVVNANASTDDPKLFNSEAIRVPGLYPAMRGSWKASVDAYYRSSTTAHEAICFNHALGDCGATVYVELDTSLANVTCDIDANTYKYLHIWAVVQMISGDDDNYPFIEYKVGSTWYKKVLSKNDFYVYDSTKNIYEETPSNIQVNMTGEADWVDTIVGIRFGAWNDSKPAQELRWARLLSIIPLEYSNVYDGWQEQIIPTSPCIDRGDPSLYDSYVEGIGYLARGGSRSDQGCYGGGSDTPSSGLHEGRAGYVKVSPESNVRKGRISTEGLLHAVRQGYCVGAEPSITTEGFTSMSERLLNIGDMGKNIIGQTLQDTSCDATVIEFDNEDKVLYDEVTTQGLLYPKVFSGVITAVAGNVVRDDSQNFSGITLTGFFEILSGQAIGKRYYIIFNDTDSCTVLLDLEDSFSTDPETDGVLVGDSYRIDAAYEIWFQIRTGYKELPGDRLLWMGGIINQKQITHALTSRTVAARILGFEKLLETYDAFDVCEDDVGAFYFIPGVKVLRYKPASNTPLLYGPREMLFHWEDARIEGAEVYEVQGGNIPGLKTLEFRPPNYFRYNGGAWSERSGAQTEYLYDAQGNSISVKHSGNYPDECTEVFLVVADKYKPYVFKQGFPTLKLGEGRETLLMRSFVTILLHENGVWTDVTDRLTYGKHVNKDEDPLVSGFTGYDAELYLLSSETFTGIDLTLDAKSTFVGYLSYLYYSGGAFSSFDSTELVDETSYFSTNGKITWAPPKDWARSDVFATGLANYSSVYAVKIRVDTRMSGTVIISQLQKAFRIIDQDGMGVDVSVAQDQIPWEDTSDTVIIRKNGVLGTWYHMIDFQTLATRAATEFGFPAGCREFEDLKFTWETAKLGVWGKLPRISGDNKIPTTIVWDDQTSILYVGFEDELWAVPENGSATKLEIMPHYEEFVLHIFRLVIVRDTNYTYIRGVAWKPYDDNYYYINEDTVATDYSKAWMNAPACAFSYNVTLDTFEYSFIETTSQWDGKDYASLFPGVMTTRPGKNTHVPGQIYDALFNYMVGKGREEAPGSFPHDAGENLVVPVSFNNHIRVNAHGIYSSADHALCVAEKRQEIFGLPLFPNRGTKYATWAFLWNRPDPPMGWENFGPKGQTWVPPAGFYALTYGWQPFVVGYFHPMWKLGQPGYVVWDPINKKWVSRIWDGDPLMEMLSGTWKDMEFDHTSNVPTERSTDKNLISQQVLHGAWDSTSLNLYVSTVNWIDGWGSSVDVPSLAWIAKLTDAGYEHTWDFYTGVAFEDGSAMGTNIYAMALELCFDPKENVFHGCILDRKSLKYYYMIYDHVNSKMYAVSIESSPYYQLKSFAYNSSDQKMYFAVCDVRYGQVGAVIMRANFDPERTKGDWLEVETVGSPDETEWDIPFMTASGGRVFGFTGPNEGYIFQLSETFYPRAQYADLTDLNGRQLFEHLCSPLGMRMRIHEDNTIKIKDLHL